MNIVLSHVVNSGMAAPRLAKTKLFGGSFNGSLECLKWLRNTQDDSIWEPPRNLVPINQPPDWTFLKFEIFTPPPPTLDESLE